MNSMKKITTVCLILLTLGLIGQAFLQKPQPATLQARRERPVTAPVATADTPERQRPLVDLRGKEKIEREEVLFAEGSEEATRMSGGDADEREEREAKAGSRKGRYSFVGHVPKYAQQGAGNAAQVTNNRPTEHQLNRAGRSFTGDLRTLPQTKPVKQERPEHEGPAPAPRVKGDVAPPTAPSGAARITAPAAAAPAPSISFDGLDFATWGAGHPPDTVGDVGPTYYIQAINTSIGIFNKTGGAPVAAFTFNTFMSQGNFGNLCDTNNFGDPVILYDTFEDRWVITDFAFATSGGNAVAPVYQCFAVSKTSDPVMGGWNYYSLQTTDALGDYPKFGIWPDGIYMSANMFGLGVSSGFQNPRVWALNKAQMYAGAPNIQVVSFDAPSADFTLLPANARLQTGTPPAGTPNFFVSTWQFVNALTVYKFHVDWNHPSLSTFTGPDAPLAATSWPNASVANAPSSGGNSLDVLQIRAMMQNQYTNIGGAESLWTTHTVRRANTTGFAASRWYQVNVTGGMVNANLPQAATWDPDGANVLHRFIPSLALDRAGDLALGYSTSSSTTKPAIKYAGRLASDPANTFSQTEQLLIQGTGTQTGTCGGVTCTRWGDYASMTLAPDGCTFWFTSMYYSVDGLNHLTRIGSFTYPSCTALGTGGTLSGTVTAAVGGAPLAGVNLTLGNRTATTDGSGFYQFLNLPAGNYVSLTASKASYVTGSASNVVVNDGNTTTQDFALTMAAASGCFTDTTQLDFQTGVPTNTDLTASPNAVVLALPSLDQQNKTLGTSGVGITITTWGGQTFTPSVTGTLTKADVNLFCSGCTGTTPNLTLSVRATSGGLPTGADLAVATITGFGSGAATFYTATFASPPTLTAGTQYALVIRPTANPSPGTYALTRSGSSTAGADVYAGGTRVSGATSGTVWSIPLTAGVSTDAGFRTYMSSGYSPSGNLVSNTKDANPPAGFTLIWGTFSWTATTPANTGVKFQVAASNNADGPFNFVGPDSTAATFFTTSGASLAQFNGLRYLQYKAYLSTTDNTMTPTLNDVSLCFNNVSPVTATVSGDATICAGTQTNVTVAVSGGTPPYTIKLSDGSMQSGSGPNFTIPVMPSMTTVYTLASGSVDSNNLSITGSGSATVMVNQPPAPPAITPNPAQVCAGSTGNQASGPAGATSYAWAITNGTITSAANLQTITYTAGAAGNVTLSLTVTNAANCSASNSAMVPINALPSPPSITPNPAQVCASSTGNQASGPAGASSYAWTISNGTITSAANLPTITYTAGAAGNVTLNLTVTNAAGCSASNSANVPINPIPATPTITPGGPTTFCAGGSVVLTSSSATGNQWLLNGSPIGGATNQTLTANASGDYTVMVTASGCSSNPSAATTVTVNPTPAPPTITPGGPTTFCAGGSVVLTSSSATGNQWFLNGSPIGGATSQTFTANASGNYSVAVTVSGCPSAPSAATTVTVTPNPTPANAGPDQTVCGLTTTLAGNTPSVGTGTWSLVNGPGTLTFGNVNAFNSTATASAAGAYTLRWTITNGSCTSADEVVVNFIVVTVNPATLSNGAVGTPYNATLTATPAGTYNFAVTGGALPGGLSLSTAGVLGGTLAAAGTFNFTVTATSTIAPFCSASRAYTVTTSCPTITLSPASLPGGQVGTAYNQTLTASPAGGNYSYAVTSGVLPPGLTLNTATGAITGTPSAANNYAFSITATGFNGCTGTQAYNLLITANCSTVTLNPASLLGGTTGVAYSQTLTPSGGTAPYTFTVSSGTLPPGLTLTASADGTTATLAGTPTAGGTYIPTIKATGQGGCNGQRTYVITIACGTFTFSPATLPNGSVGQPYSQTVSVTPAATPFSIQTGQLPLGFTLNAATGVISGTTSQTGTYNFTLKAVSGTCQPTKSYTIVINGAAAALARIADYDGDRKADPALWQASQGQWRIVRSSDQQPLTRSFGGAGDVALLGDYDGDGKTDLTVFRPGPGTFYVERSSDGQFIVQAWGAATDVPVPGDYDGDGKTDFAVWRPADGNWYVLRSSDGQYTVTAWGAGVAPYNDVAVPGDYDGDGKTDLAVFRRSTGTWLVKRSSDGQFIVKVFGIGTDTPVAQDYDGDGQTDIAIWRGGMWYIWQSATQTARVVSWGASDAPYNDQAAPADYDGDGQADVTVWRVADGAWYIRCSVDDSFMTRTQSANGAVPVALAARR